MLILYVSRILIIWRQGHLWNHLEIEKVEGKWDCDLSHTHWEQGEFWVCFGFLFHININNIESPIAQISKSFSNFKGRHSATNRENVPDVELLFQILSSLMKHNKTLLKFDKKVRNPQSCNIFYHICFIISAMP